jgi:thymidylate synthase
MSDMRFHARERHLPLFRKKMINNQRTTTRTWWLLKGDTAAIILDNVKIIQSIENKTEQRNKYFSAEHF